MANSNLTQAKRAKNDEFYTQYPDIQKEIGAYLMYDPDTFRNKVVYCNCDDPFESNFFKYFVLNFKRLGLKKLITTSYKPSPVANTEIQLTLDVFNGEKPPEAKKVVKGRPKVTANKFVITEVGDYDGDGQFNLEDVAKQLKANKHNEWTPLDGDGDFQSQECIELLKQSDIVVTNPPFSLFREYVKQLFDYDKKFVIIGSMNAITYKEIFPLVKGDKLWLGNGFSAGNAYFATPNARSDFASGVYDEKTGLVKFRNCHWFTNLDHGRRHQPLQLMTMADNLKFNKKMKGKTAYDHYDNYDAIEVPFTDAIPNDYEGVMGVPISFLDKYSPEQFEILGTSDNGIVDDSVKLTPGLTQKFVDDYYAAGGTGAYKGGNPTAGFYDNGIAKMTYKRIFIKHRKAAA
jgi:hypothetical protein